MPRSRKLNSTPCANAARSSSSAGQQIRAAIQYYQNGTPYEFYHIGLHDTGGNLDGLKIKRCHGPGCAKWEGELENGKELLTCGGCKKVCYCDRECQAKDRPFHKKACRIDDPVKGDPKFTGRVKGMINVMPQMGLLRE